MRNTLTITLQAFFCSMLLLAGSAYAADAPADTPIPLALPPAPVSTDEETPPLPAPPATTDTTEAAAATEETTPPSLTAATTVDAPITAATNEEKPATATKESKEESKEEATPAVTEATEGTQPENKSVAKTEPLWKGSLMFFPSDLKALSDALEEAKNAPDMTGGIGSIVSDLNNSMKSFMPNIVANLAPTYYLNSILYVSPNNWSIWVNGIKYSSKTQRFAGGALEELQVEKVSPQWVRFRAKVRLLDRISPNWQAKFTPNAEGNFEADDIGNLYINKEKDHIRFTLQPNQRLELAHMEVSEGKME